MHRKRFHNPFCPIFTGLKFKCATFFCTTHSNARYSIPSAELSVLVVLKSVPFAFYLCIFEDLHNYLVFWSYGLKLMATVAGNVLLTVSNIFPPSYVLHSFPALFQFWLQSFAAVCGHLPHIYQHFNWHIFCFITLSSNLVQLTYHFSLNKTCFNTQFLTLFFIAFPAV